MRPLQVQPHGDRGRLQVELERPQITLTEEAVLILTGHCHKCGAEVHVPDIWNAITPPPATYTCMCYSYERKPREIEEGLNYG